MVADLQLSPEGDLPAPVSDCWNAIGVNGNGSCRELTRFIHCRNCPVYSAAALQLLDRPISNEHRREWTEHFSTEKRFAASAKVSVVLFRVGREWLSLPTQAFQEIAERRAMHSLPHRHRGVVMGLVNVRGELLICASLGRLLGLETEPALPRSRTIFERLLVANWGGQRIVFPVDEVHGIHHVNGSELREAPATLARSAQAITRGVFAWTELTVGLLDAETLFAALNRNLT